MSYSEEERRTTLQEVVQGNLSFPSDRLGPRDLSTDYNEAVELVHSILVYDPDAVIYLIRLAANGLNRTLLTEINLCDDLLDAVDDLSQPNRPINSVSGLRTARNALINMESSVNRGGALGPNEYRRYRAGMARVKDELARAVRMTYVPRGSSEATTDVVRPLPEAKAAVVSAYTSLKEQHTRLIAAVQRVLGALGEFNSGKLEALLGRRQLSRALVQVDELYELLDPLEPEERTMQARTALLRVLVNESSVRALARRSVPGLPKLSQAPDASPLYRTTAYGVGSAPSLVGVKSGPFALSSTAKYLSFASLNNDPTPPSIDLVPGGVSDVAGVKAASITGTISGPFSVSGDLATPHPLLSDTGTFNITATDSWFYINVDGSMYRKQLSSGGTQSATTVAGELEASASWIPSKPTITVSESSGRVQIAYSGSTVPYRARSMEVVRGNHYADDLWIGTHPSNNWLSGPSGVTSATKTQGWDANDKIRIKANDDTGYVEVSLPNGTWPNYSVDAGPVATPGTVGYAIDDDGGALFTAVAAAADSQVVIQSELLGEGSVITLLSEGLHANPHAKEGFGTASYLGLRTLGFVENQEVRESDVSSQAVANLLNANSDFNAEAVASISRQEYLTSRRATRVTDTTLRVTFSGDDPSTGWPAYGEMKLVIENGANRGIYGLASAVVVSAPTITFTLDRKLRDATSGLLHTIKLYRERLVITSTDVGVDGVLELDDPANSARTVLGLSDTPTTSTVSEVLIERNDPTYGWRPLDVSRRKIRVGDKLLAGTLVEQAEITSVANAAEGRLSVSPEVAPTFALSTEGFYIYSGAYEAYRSFIENLSSWQEATLPPYEENLDRLDQLLAPILLTVPSKDRVDSVYLQVRALRDKLADTDALLDILSSFSVTRIRSVDTMLDALLEQGFDRVRDLLLAGSFSDFFSSVASSSSYARAFQRSVNEVAVEDVNESAAARGRWDAEFTRIRAQWEEDRNPQLDFSDFEDELPEDPLEEFYPGVNEYVGD